MKHGAIDQIRLARWHEYTTYAAIAVLTLSGVVWLICRFFLAEQGEYGPMPHAWEGTMLELHGAAAMLTLFFVGSLLVNHMFKAWKLRLNRVSGGSMALLCLVLTATGYGLYYIADEELRAWVSWAHWLPGIAMPLLLGVHVYLGTRKPKEKSKRRTKPRPRVPVDRQDSHPAGEAIH